jgi:hypothetical protein
MAMIYFMQKHLVASIILALVVAWVLVFALMQIGQRLNLSDNIRLFLTAVPIPVLMLSFYIYLVWNRNYRYEGLREHGQKITATITSVQEKTNVRLNYRHPFVIIAAWQDPQTQKIYSFVSRTISFDPRPRLSGSTIDVYIDPKDPSHYYVDLSVLNRTQPVNVYQQLHQTQQEVDQLKQQVSDLEKKKNPN